MQSIARPLQRLGKLPGRTLRKNPTGAPCSVTASMRAVVDQAEAPKLSAEMTLVPEGSATWLVNTM